VFIDMDYSIFILYHQLIFKNLSHDRIIFIIKNDLIPIFLLKINYQLFFNE
jgi:hypothetical protein